MYAVYVVNCPRWRGQVTGRYNGSVYVVKDEVCHVARDAPPPVDTKYIGV